MNILDKIKPPPIFVKEVENFPELCLTLDKFIGVDNFICMFTTDCLNIKTSNPDATQEH